ncbi:MAG: hypothetical protein QOI63_1696 [Thermoplasmata archaeon]|jgi:hypothetical protein|nr:hypothetical protein [Thermoplasmata archaeon]
MQIMATTIPIEAIVRDRLKTFGHAGMTYSEILSRMMDRIERDEFVREMRRLATTTKSWVPHDQVDWD